MEGWVQCLVAFSNCISSAVREERQGSSVNITQIVAEGDASVTLAKLKVKDEGSYICSVSLGPFRAQQIIQLHLFRKYSLFVNVSGCLSDVFPGCCCRAAPGFTVTGEVGF